MLAALSAAAPAMVAVAALCESPYVSGTVTADANGFHRAHGSSVTPLLLFSQLKERGYVLGYVYLSVCLSVCPLDNSKF